ncbi:MAG: methyltransferase domain-containing protein [Phycisphaerales bacterium]|nr:MAG: methyltransferase domain-containing protein [Phycisphaerales bacterium]
MSKYLRFGIVITAILILCGPVTGREEGQGRESFGGRGYREAASYVIKRLGLRRNSVVVDIGAGDGWWASKMAEKLGPKGLIHAGEVDQEKVDAMEQKWQDVSQIKPYLCPTDGTGLGEDSCHVAFISKTYHHFAEGTHVDYLRHLKEVVKPSGRVVIIERHADLASGRGKEHGWQPGLLGQQAEQAGWMLLRCELIPRSDHFMAIFVQPEAFAKRFAKRLPAARSEQRQGKP